MDAKSKPTKLSIEGWEVCFHKDDIKLTIEAENTSNSSLYFCHMTNDDIAKKEFKLIEDINDLYECLLAGGDESIDTTHLSINDHGKLIIAQSVLQGRNIKTILNEIVLEKKETNDIERLERQIQKNMIKQETKMKFLEDLINAAGNKEEKKNDNSEFVKSELKDYVDTKMRELEERLMAHLNTLEERKVLIVHPQFDASGEFASNFNLSNNNKTAENKAHNYSPIFAQNPLPSSAKLCEFSFRIVKNASVMLGIASKDSLVSQYPYENAASFGYYYDGNIYSAKGQGRNCGLPKFASGDIVTFRMGMETGEIIIKLNDKDVHKDELNKSYLNSTQFYPFLYIAHTKGGCAVEFL